MKRLGILLAALAALWVLHGGAAYAQKSDSCKVCADQQRACMKNYAGPTCKSEYQMCMKSCKSK